MNKVTAIWMMLILTSPSAFARPAQVLLIRHGEKPAQGNDLSDQGWERAKALPSLFSRPEFQAHGAPVALFAQKPQGNGKEARPFETLKYVAESLHLTIDTDFPRDDVNNLTHEILTNPAYDKKFVVVCWEHKVLEDIAAALGVNPKPEYPGDRFDRAWLLTYTPNGGPQLQDLPEHLLAGDGDK